MIVNNNNNHICIAFYVIVSEVLESAVVVIIFSNLISREGSPVAVGRVCPSVCLFPSVEPTDL